MARREGHKWLRSAALYRAPDGPVDSERGIIRGVAIVTPGEALGHGIRLDEEFCQEVVSQLNAKPNGLKARFGHPTMSGEALGTFLGCWKNGRMDRSGEVALARADLFLSQEAKDAPGNGDLWGWTCEHAANHPDAFGSSIVFEEGAEYFRAEDGTKRYKADLKPEERPNELPFVECKKLFGADLVDDPAANPGGLLSAWPAGMPAGEMTAFLDEHPEIFKLLAESPDIVPAFLRRYEAYLERKEGATMAEEQESVAQAAEAAAPPATEALAEPPKATDQAPPGPAAGNGPTNPAAPSIAELAKPYIERFGDDGKRWFAEGRSLEECQTLAVAGLRTTIEAQAAEIAGLKGEVEELEARLAVARKHMGVAPENAPAFQAEAAPKEESEFESLAGEYEKNGLTREAAEKRARRILKARAAAKK